MVFIIADGIPADVIENATIPNLKRLGQYKRAYTAGDLGTYTQTVTISSPGYMNILTGTWGINIMFRIMLSSIRIIIIRISSAY